MLRTGLALLLVLGSALAAGAQAQPAGQAEACRAPVLALARPPDEFAPGDARTLRFAIENPNGAPVHSVRATITTTAPAGWTATPGQRELTLGPKNVSMNSLAITAPNRGSGAPAGNITVHVTFVCTTGDVLTTASASAQVPVRIREFDVPWPVVLGAFLLMVAGVAVLGVRRVRRGVAIAVSQPEREVHAGKSAKFTFVVENRRGRPQAFHLLATGLPPGWGLHLALQDVGLEPGEEKTLWALLKAPPGAQPGERAEVTLRLESARGGRDRAQATLRARVVEDG